MFILCSSGGPPFNNKKSCPVHPKSSGIYFDILKWHTTILLYFINLPLLQKVTLILFFDFNNRPIHYTPTPPPHTPKRTTPLTYHHPKMRQRPATRFRPLTFHKMPIYLNPTYTSPQYFPLQCNILFPANTILIHFTIILYFNYRCIIPSTHKLLF